MEMHIVNTTNGKVRGYERNQMVEYLGIPYAEAPVGNRRFKRAVPKAAWEGVFDAKEYGAPPVQFHNGRVMGDEDCLTVNIQRPVEGTGLPVFVWIYGGAFSTGYSSDDMYSGEAFVKDGIVFVSFNYRLNVLGFYDFTTYPGCEAMESNCGLSDQILALNWIHDNIEAFGGDPNRITIGGESAGGSSVINMLACPGVKGTFQQAIVESGLPNCIMTHEMARKNIDLFMEGMHWTEEDLHHLFTDDPKLFLTGVEYVVRKHQYVNPGMFLPGPVVDDLLPVRPLEAIRNGSAQGIRLIIGTNLHEGTMFVHPENTGFPNSWTMVADMLERNKNAEGLLGIMEYYYAQQEDAFIRFATDYAFEMPSVKVAEAQKSYTPDVWMYRYELVTKSSRLSGWRASHACELPAVFVKPDHPFTAFSFDGEAKELFDKISNEMHGDWAAFIKHANPNDKWPRFEGAVSPVRIYDRETQTAMLDRQHMMDVWGDMRFYEG